MNTALREMAAGKDDMRYRRSLYPVGEIKELVNYDKF